MKRRLLFFCMSVVACLATGNVFPQNQNITEVALDSLQIKDRNLIPILDSIITAEKCKDYYFPGMRFYINISNNAYQISGYGRTVVSNDLLGVFSHNDYTFIVAGDMLNPNVFGVSAQKQKIDFWKKPSYIDEKTGKIVLVSFIDDRFSFWIYHYTGVKFINTYSFDTQNKIEYINPKR